ncbi:hypothetical protein KJ855_02460 [Patescibacteria group bacterium]|nr:hypothetical protein [Patescibacteria group bacterium]
MALLKSDCYAKKKTIGRIVEVIVSVNKPRVIGIVVRKGIVGGKLYFVSVENIVKMEGKILYTKNYHEISQAENNVEKIYRSGLLVMGRVAYDKQKNRLGRIVDFDFDEDSGWINRFSVDKGLAWWRQSKILPGRYFVEIRKNGVYFDVPDGLEVLKESAELELAV